MGPCSVSPHATPCCMSPHCHTLKKWYYIFCHKITPFLSQAKYKICCFLSQEDIFCHNNFMSEEITRYKFLSKESISCCNRGISKKNISQGEIQYLTMKISVNNISVTVTIFLTQDYRTRIPLKRTDFP